MFFALHFKTRSNQSKRLISIVATYGEMLQRFGITNDVTLMEAKYVRQVCAGCEIGMPCYALVRQQLTFVLAQAAWT